VGRSFGQITWEAVLYVILSLTLVRMLPVFLTLAGMNLRTDEKLFMGWFGSRGLAIIVIDEHLPGGGTITITAACTIMLSIVSHGLSANPLVAALVARLKRSEQFKGECES
jgi:NhaP-type Na+/H+ or K+/H+ antiporter